MDGRMNGRAGWVSMFRLRSFVYSSAFGFLFLYPWMKEEIERREQRLSRGACLVGNTRWGVGEYMYG